MPKLKLKKPKLKLKKPSKKTLLSTKFISSVLVVLALVGFGYSGYYWYSNTYTNSENVFYGMIDKSLNTSSVMRTAEQPGANRSESQAVYLKFGPEVALHTKTYLQQITQDRQVSTVETETAADRENDYVKYTNISIPNEPGNQTDYSKVLNVWAKRGGTDQNGENQAQFLDEAAFTFVPFGNFPDDKRAELIKKIRDEKVYELARMAIQYENGRPVMVGYASINPRKFVEVMRDYAEMTDIGNLAELDPSQYSDVNNFTIQVKIDVISRHLKEITYPSGDRVEKFYGYGVNRPINLPENTISVEELQAKLQQN